MTDGQGQTDVHLCSSNTSACIACYYTALVKIAHQLTKYTDRHRLVKHPVRFARKEKELPLAVAVRYPQGIIYVIPKGGGQNEQ